MLLTYGNDDNDSEEALYPRRTNASAALRKLKIHDHEFIEKGPFR
jgi:hypothetical protein